MAEGGSFCRVCYIFTRLWKNVKKEWVAMLVDEEDSKMWTLEIWKRSAQRQVARYETR